MMTAKARRAQQPCIVTMAAKGVQMPDKRDFTTEFIRIGRDIASLLYRPVKAGGNSRVAVFIMHSDSDYLTFPLAAGLAARGFTVLCQNNSHPNGGRPVVGLDRKIMDAGFGVKMLRETPGIEKVVLMGHSGGGTLLSAYQSIAENGAAVFQDEAKIVKCPDALGGLPAADGLMLLDSNFGNAPMSLFSIDPAIVDEHDTAKIDPALDLFNPQNGFSPDGSSYGEAFIKRFLAAQSERNMRLIDGALERLHAIERGKGWFNDDEPLVIAGAANGFMNNKLYAQDIRLMSRTRKARQLVHKDGSVTVEVVRSLRKPENNKSFTADYREGALVTTVRGYLNEFAVRTGPDYGYDGDTVRGVVWESGYDTPVGNVRGIRAPMLVMGMTAGWEFAAAETIFENATSCTDKTLAYVEGANHMFQTAKGCEAYPGQFGDTGETTYGYVAAWLGQPGRFL
jgi:pimeloyl-ACP methyl ester carboxylesterase